MKRGDFVTVALQGDYGKPRPALVIQADQFDATETVTVVLVTGTLVDAPLCRHRISPEPGTGLGKESDIMLDKAMTVRRSKIGSVIGQATTETMLEISRKLAVFLGIAA